MKIKKEKIISTIALVLCLIFVATNSFAAVSHFKGEINPEGSDTVKSILSTVLAIVRTVGAGVAVLILMVIGCKYMLASAGERAEIKKYAIHYVVGAVVLFASSAIISIIKSFVDSSLS